MFVLPGFSQDNRVENHFAFGACMGSRLIGANAFFHYKTKITFSVQMNKRKIAIISIT